MTTMVMEKESNETDTTKVNVVTTTIATSTTVKNKDDTTPSSPPAPVGFDKEAGKNDQFPAMDDDHTTVTGNNMRKDSKAAAAGNTPPTLTVSTDVHVPPATTTPSSPLTSEHSSRFPLWYALLVFSAVTLISLLTDHKHTPSTLNTTIASATTKFVWFAEEKWILSVTVMSLLLSCMACVAQFTMRQNFVGMPLEGLVLFTELGFWVGGLIVMMDTDNSLAVDADGNIVNANLYFFSWLSLITTVCLLVRYGEQVNDSVMATSGNIACAGYWAGICVASLVAMASSIETFAKGVTLGDGRQYDCPAGQDFGSGYCERLKFAVALSVIGTVFAGICSLFSFKMTSAVHASASFLMLFAWALGVAFVTFGEKSPGNSVGNLYFSSWFAFVLSLFMVSTSIKNYLAERERRRGQTETDEDNKAGDPSLDTERGERTDDEKTTSPSEGPLTPASAATPKLEIKPGNFEESDEDTADPNVPVPNVAIPVRV